MKRTKIGARKAIVTEILKPNWSPESVIMICNSIKGVRSDKVNTGNTQINKMIMFAADLFDTTKVGKHRGSQVSEHVISRNMIYYHLRDNTNMSIVKIGKIFSKHHSTVIHGAKTFKKDMDINFMGCADKYSIFKDMLNP